MQDAHLRLGRLEYTRTSEKTNTHIFLHVDRYMGDGSQAHLLSLFGNDAEVGAITAAIHENHTFNLIFPDGRTQVAGFGKDVSCYRGSLNVPDRKQPLRHLIALSASLHGNGSAGQTFVMNYQPHTQNLTWAALASLLGLPADPRWGEHVLRQLQHLDKIKPLPGIGCDPVVIHVTREELLEQIGRACAAGSLPFPKKNGPILWPRFTMRDALASS
ncbi:hypothetical protein [Tunturiibacter psychrotolerans]|uniref:hypothetical protein n=1 Tax=Tunturiibacter psychrotolerans TaxID=3069686 RepID=UPI003D19A114